MVKNLKRLKKQTERELGKAEGQRYMYSVSTQCLSVLHTCTVLFFREINF